MVRSVRGVRGGRGRAIRRLDESDEYRCLEDLLGGDEDALNDDSDDEDVDDVPEFDEDQLDIDTVLEMTRDIHSDSVFESSQAWFGC